MNAATECEALFNKVGDLGCGVAALGDLLKFGKDDAFPETLNGVGIVLRHLGETMRDLNAKFHAAPYNSIVALVEKEARRDVDLDDSELRAAQQLSKILDGAMQIAPGENNQTTQGTLLILPTAPR